MEEFTITKSVNKQGVKIVVIGVGGGGQNMLDTILKSPVSDHVKIVAVNSDIQALDKSKAPYKVQIGPKLTNGLGCGMDPEVGRQSALESLDEIREVLLDL